MYLKSYSIISFYLKYIVYTPLKYMVNTRTKRNITPMLAHGVVRRRDDVTSMSCDDRFIVSHSTSSIDVVRHVNP